jgi:hypothetical protein
MITFTISYKLKLLGYVIISHVIKVKFLPEKNTRPGSMARVELTRPAPKSKGVEGDKLPILFPSAIISSPLLSYLVAVVEIADAIIDGVQRGLHCLMSAAIPAI